MIRHLGSILLGLAASLAIFWLAAFLVREPAQLDNHGPHIIKMPRLLEDTAYVFPVRDTQEKAWWETGPWIYCCRCPSGGLPFLEPSFAWPKTAANVSLPLSRPATPALYSVTASSLFEGQWEPAVIEAAYPRQALARGIEGSVLVEITLAADGNVIAATILSASPEGLFDKAALKAVLAARFSAPVQNGQQVYAASRRVLIRFRLPASA